MKNRRKRSGGSSQLRSLTWLLTMLLSVLSMKVQASDWMKNSSKFSMENHTDHVTFKVFLCDLDRSNTYAKEDGTIRAESPSGEVKYLIDLVYIEEGSDENPFGKVRARYCLGESRAWFTNGYGSAEQKIGFNSADYLLQKWGDDNHYLTTALDYYFPASMAGKYWSFYYRYKHNDGGTYDMYLGSCTLSSTLGKSHFDTSKYSVERTNPSKIKFTVPALPDDVDSKFNDIHIHEGKYKVSFTYTKQDNSTVTTTDEVYCEVNKKKTYDISIPDEVGNPKQIDMSVVATDGLRDANNYYWKDTKTYNKTNVFHTVPNPSSLMTEYRQFEGATDLSWKAFPSENSNYLECTPYIYRMETDKDGTALNGSWTRRGSLGNAGTNQTLSFQDKSVGQSTYYKYMVLNVPKDWINNGINSSALNSPDDALLANLGYVVSEPMSTAPTMSYRNLRQDTAVVDKVRLTWQYSRIPVTSSTVKFKVLRKKTVNGEWAEYGNVTGDAEPGADAELSFEDSDLPNPQVRYQYKIRLELNNGKNVFDSEPLTAGFLKGTMVNTFEATKGTHEGTVRLTWTAHQVGTDATMYDISRRYVGGDGDFIKINTTTGTAERFTYEDNTVQPGFYYEYKIESYSGDVIQNTLTDAGFCQARGVIAGRVTYGTGSSVEDVRLSLRPSDTGDDNAVKGYSQRVDGVSTGIAWEADSAGMAKVFGTDKDFTVQMFVRPDEGLSEGAVIGEIPGVGRLIVGGQVDEGYKLYCVKPSDMQIYNETYYNNSCAFRAIYYDDRKSEDYTYEGEKVYTFGHQDNITKSWEEEGYVYVTTYSANWVDRNAYICLYRRTGIDLVTKKKGHVRYSYYDSGLTIPAGEYSLFAVRKSNGKLEMSVNDSISTSMTLVKENEPSDSDFEIEIDNEPLVMFNGTAISFKGSELSSLSTTNWIWQGRFPSLSPSVLSNRDVDVPVPLDDNAAFSLAAGAFSVGGAKNIKVENGFHGNFTEVRVWDHSLTEKEQASYKDRILNGREKGLALYWPLDEGLTHYAFDASYSNDMPNGRHAVVGSNITTSTIVPQDERLSRYAVTNENGEYIIRGIPFKGSGSTYTVVPTRGIHDFSPVSRNGFIGNGNLTLNGYDFTDVSSFPVRGKVTYLNTNIPADSIQFKIDDALVQTNSGLVVSDANGEYEISVPIGSHTISAYKDGHRLTSFPLDGSKYEFKREEIVNFVDSTLVNVTGRINGGFSDKDEPIGFKRSVNRLGKATLKLSLGKEAQCSFNYVVDEHGDGHFGTKNIPVESASKNIASSAYRAGGEHDDTYYIYITTDESTGEFSAMLPPLKYKVESITFGGGTDYDNLPIFAQNLPMIDATNTVDSKMLTDSIAENGTSEKYKYTAKMIRQYRAEPSISVVQNGMKNGAFGSLKVPVFTLQNEIDSLQVTEYNGTDYTYRFGKPIFVQRTTYDFDIDIAEEYKNLDTNETFKEVPRDAIISIENDASVLTSVLGDKAIIDGKEEAAGAEVSSPNIQIIPDSLGHVSYSFVGGWPNLADGHLRNLSIGVSVNGRTTMWKAPNSESDALDMILIGCLPTGTNFMSDGPDKVDYVIRRPGGSTSVASYEKTEINTYSTTTIETEDDTWGGGTYVSLAPTFEIAEGTGAFFGPIIMAKSKWQVVANETVTRVNGSRDADYYTEKTSYTLTEKTSTPNSIPFSSLHMDYRPESGDTYIGHATNLTFSKARNLGIYQQSDNSYKLDEKDGIAMSEEFKTHFIYTQEYIEDILIPNWKSLIKDRLIHVEGNHWDESNPSVKKVPGEVRYYTSYSPSDKEFGRANGDPLWGNLAKERNGWPSYRMVNGKDEGVDDEVEHAINQIIAWESAMASNEADKIKAFEDNTLIENVSISGGATYNRTNKTEKTTTTSHKHTTYKTVNSETKFGTLFNNAGAYGIYKQTWYDAEETDKDSIQTQTSTVAWTLSDGDPRSALSVDVYNSPKGWGPIFRTRAGQTVNPYEGETRTEYYAKGSASEKLNEATMRVENPQLKVVGSSSLTDIPTGSEAKFTLQLFNGSETNSYCNYILQVKDNSNPNGAILMMDGSPLSNGKTGRAIKMSPGQTIEKILLVSQSDRSVTKYNNIQLELKSEKDMSIVSDPVLLNVEFVPASAHIDLSVDHTVLNKVDKDQYQGITATMLNLDRSDAGLRGVRLRYRRKGTDSWTLLKQWSNNDEDLTMGYEPLPEGSRFTEKVAFLDDGLYELQAQTFGKYGNEDVTYESSIIDITQDTHGPKILGMPSPENGLLTYMNRNNMHIKFNEQLNGNALSKSDNFRIEGGLNNVVSGGMYPDVAVQLNGNTIETDALYDLSATNFGFGMWFYRQSDGNIIRLGTDSNNMTLSTHDDGILQVRLGSSDNVYDSGVQLPADKWVFMSMNYSRRENEQSSNKLSLMYATADDAEVRNVFRNENVSDVDGHGKLSISGEGMVGMMAGLSFWNEDVTALDIYQNRKQTLATYTPGLVGLWDMTEGHGLQITDRVRARHMFMPTESWYVNNENKAAHIDADHTLPIDISTFNLSKTDNYAIEMWFRGESSTTPLKETLFSTQNGVKVGFSDNKMNLSVVAQSANEEGVPFADVKYETVLSNKNYLDNNWHHFALNVRRGSSAVAYIDGEAVKVIPESSLPGISGSKLYVGSWEILSAGEPAEAFVGDIDEVRLWSAALDGQLIKERMYERLDNSYAGLVGYFPMESIARNSQGTVVTSFSTDNFGEPESRVKILSELTPSLNAPALKPGSTKMRMEDAQFSFTASGDELYFTFPENTLPYMDGNDFVATVKYIKDEHGNNSEPVEWMFHADFAAVSWYPNNVPQPITYVKKWDETVEFETSIYNRTGQSQSYEVSGAPSWLQIDKPVGTITGEYDILKFTVGPTVPVGKHIEYLYLTDRLGIKRMLQLNLTVTGDVPNWSVDPNLYESNMTLTGQIYIKDKICENTDTKIAAFDNSDNCRGVGHPVYVPSRDAYYVDMVIYGGSSTEISTGERELHFELYDASTGNIHPLVEISIPGKEEDFFMRYAPDVNYGTYSEPVVFTVMDFLQQPVSLPKGWSWMSIYVDPLFGSIKGILPTDLTVLKRFKNIKSQNAFSTVNSNGEVMGELQTFAPGQMYKLQLSAKTDFDVYGLFINVTQTEQTIAPGYNWIGTLSNVVMSVEDAFAELEPKVGDRIKNRTSFAEFSDNGIWEGTLKGIVPGEGYIYRSMDTKEKTFHYPLRVYSVIPQAKQMLPEDDVVPMHYTPVDNHLYPDNMNMIAVVKKDGVMRDDAEIGAFIDGECRGAIGYNSGFYFLTVMGSSEYDTDKKLELRVFVDGEEYVVDNSLPFASDAFYGSLEEPYVLDVDATAIRTIVVDDGDDDGDWYTLQGHRIGRKPTQQGVYIHHGKKVTIYRNRR